MKQPDLAGKHITPLSSKKSLVSAKPQLLFCFLGVAKKKQNLVFVALFLGTMSRYLHSWQLGHHPHTNYYLPRNMGDGHNSGFIAHNTYSNEDPYLWAVTNNNISGEYTDGVFVIDDTALFRTTRHLSQHNRLATHHYSALWDPYSYHQFIDDAYVTTDDVNALVVTMQNLDRNFGSRLSGQPFDYRALLDLGHHHTEVGYQEEEEEEIMMMKTRTHCAKVEVDSEICSICLCEYVNDETIGILECGHEYHATCIEQWLLRGKKNCPICRSSVLSSQQHTES